MEGFVGRPFVFMGDMGPLNMQRSGDNLIALSFDVIKEKFLAHFTRLEMEDCFGYLESPAYWDFDTEFEDNKFPVIDSIRKYNGDSYVTGLGCTEDEVIPNSQEVRLVKPFPRTSCWECISTSLKEIQKMDKRQDQKIYLARSLVGFVDAYANRRAETFLSADDYSTIVQNYTNVLTILPPRVSLWWMAYFALTKAQRRLEFLSGQQTSTPRVTQLYSLYVSEFEEEALPELLQSFREKDKKPVIQKKKWNYF
jgi:hypothetical protein